MRLADWRKATSTSSRFIDRIDAQGRSDEDCAHYLDTMPSLRSMETLTIYSVLPTEYRRQGWRHRQRPRQR